MSFPSDKKPVDDSSESGSTNSEENKTEIPEAQNVQIIKALTKEDIKSLIENTPEDSKE